MKNFENEQTINHLLRFDESYIHLNLNVTIETGVSKQLLSVKWLASQLFISERQLLRIIKKKYKMSTQEYLTDVKLGLAKQIISTNPSTSIKRVSSVLMFNDSKYFSRLFKSKFGYNPSNFKKQINLGHNDLVELRA